MARKRKRGRKPKRTVTARLSPEWLLFPEKIFLFHFSPRHRNRVASMFHRNCRPDDTTAFHLLRTIHREVFKKLEKADLAEDAEYLVEIIDAIDKFPAEAIAYGQFMVWWKSLSPDEQERLKAERKQEVLAKRS